MTSAADRLCVVVPCYNEAGRLPYDEFLAFGRQNAATIAFLFVDDGSKDATRQVIGGLAHQLPAAISTLLQPRNEGKAEAVRTGMRQGLAAGAGSVAYLDADLATPLAEIQRLHEIFVRRDLDMLIGARVALHGYDIRRKMSRHYFGRIFATLASAVLRWRIYDTQCGAKIFRATPALSAALADPFISRWGFDIELLGRMTIGTPQAAPVPFDRIAEVPLEAWYDKPGSKIVFTAMLKTVAELVSIEIDLRRRRRAAAHRVAGDA